MTDVVDVAALRVLLDVTYLPWRVDLVDGSVEVADDDNSLIYRRVHDSRAPIDAALIAASVNALPALLAELEASREKLARVVEVADDWAEDGPALVHNAYDGSNVTEGLTLERCARGLRTALGVAP